MPLGLFSLFLAMYFYCSIIFPSNHLIGNAAFLFSFCFHFAFVFFLCYIYCKWCLFFIKLCGRWPAPTLSFIQIPCGMLSFCYIFSIQALFGYVVWSSFSSPRIFSVWVVPTFTRESQYCHPLKITLKMISFFSPFKHKLLF